MVSSFVRFVVAKLRARKVEVPGQISSHRAFSSRQDVDYLA